MSLTSPKSEPALEVISRAVPSVEAHHRSVGPDAGRKYSTQRKKRKFYIRVSKHLGSFKVYVTFDTLGK